MARDFSVAFYHSKAWKNTRDAYFRSVHGLCERCKKRGVIKSGAIVHHKRHLTPENISDPSVTLNFDNLELLCRECHAIEHPEVYGKDESQKPRALFDEDGNLVGCADA